MFFIGHFLPLREENPPKCRLALPGLGLPTLDLLWPRISPRINPSGGLCLLSALPLLFSRIELSDDPSDLGDGRSSSLGNNGDGEPFGSQLADLGNLAILTAW